MGHAEKLGERRASRVVPTRGIPAPRRPDQAAHTVAPKPILAEMPFKEAVPTVERRRTPAKALSRLAAWVVLLDALVILTSIALAWPLRTLLPDMNTLPTEGVLLSAALAPFLLGSWMLLLFFNGAYAKRTFGSGAEELRSIAGGTAAAGLVASTFCYFTELPLSRGFLVGMFLLGAPLLVAERYVVRRWVRRNRLAGALRHRVLVVGSTNSINALGAILDRERHLGYEIVGCTVTQPGLTDPEQLPAQVTGSIHDVRSTCRRLGIDTVMIAGGTDVELREISWNLEGCSVDLIVVPHLADVSGPRMQMRPVAGLPLLHVEEPQAARAGEWPKRLFDVVGATVGIVVLAPVGLLVAALIKLADRGPVFYRQTRVGLRGERFEVWKFRSMAVDADAIDAELRSEHGHVEGLFKLKNDPRVTRIGSFIRKYSIDELPQLFNVLNGTMSLVGPRPHLPVEVETWTERARRRLHVRPGMTGLWQVSGRSNLSWDDAVRLDLYYRDNWSMAGDFVIIAKTVKAVLAKDGAY